jgi:mannose-1-phosphate guanylyltransferase
MSSEVKGMVLCAGLGTRLRPLSDLWPKPACPILNRPLVAFNLALLQGIGVSQVVVNTHHLADRMGQVAETQARALGLSLTLSREAQLLGTGGGLKAAEKWLADDTCLLLNGDFFFDVDLEAALQVHRRERAVATLVVQTLPPGYRPLHGRADGRLACLPGETPPADSRAWHFTGVHLLEPAFFAGLSAQRSGIFETGYRALLQRGLPVVLHVDPGTWRDIGSPESYLTTNLEAADGHLPLDRFRALQPLRPRDPNARIAGSMKESIVGAGAVIPRGASVVRSVILPNTELGSEERLDHCIAAGDLRIRLAA